MRLVAGQRDDCGIAGMQLSERELVVEVERDEQLVPVPFFAVCRHGREHISAGR